MRRFAFFAPLAVVLAVAAAGQAQPASVVVSIGPELLEASEDLGQRDVDQQVEALRRAVEQALARNGALDGARVELVLTDLKPNRPTFEQLTDRPGLSAIYSISIGGAAIEGEVITADGARRPVRYDWYSHSIEEVQGYTTWQDARRTFDRFARRLAEGRI